MDYGKFPNVNSALIVSIVISIACIAQSGPPDDQADVSQWKTITNRAGWSIKYPRTWKVGSCMQCQDPTDPKVYVTIYNPTTNEMIIIDHLTDKPHDQTVDQWLNDVKA